VENVAENNNLHVSGQQHILEKGETKPVNRGGGKKDRHVPNEDMRMGHGQGKKMWGGRTAQSVDPVGSVMGATSRNA